MEFNQEFIKNVTVYAKTLDEINKKKIYEILEKYSFARITGLIKPEEVKSGVEKLKKTFDHHKDHATTGEPIDAVYGNFQKFSIGAAKHGNVNRPRFMRTFYNPIWAEDIYGLRDKFIITAQVRNLLSDKPLNYAIHEATDGMWTAARIHHFPAGGGFMVAHKDTVLPAEYQKRSLGAFYQLVLVLTKKGEDFKSGGGFVTINDHQFNYEEYCERGDIIIYNATTLHGVDDVDVTQPFRQEKIEGRMSGLVTLYTDKRKK